MSEDGGMLFATPDGVQCWRDGEWRGAQPDSPAVVVRVNDPATGAEWAVYEDGSVSGFPEGSFVMHGWRDIVARSRGGEGGAS
ncbi:hypothetical protein ACFOGJ_16090 [Marinibaculum pumilum]|uniref:DUF2793 domain-containing protein n=1 Tax=Marinibaculum pumilum TaxID=1766165 RepID=A0ABV7L2Y9_9PROT